MAEKRINTGKNEGLQAVGMILKPFFIYYIINLITSVILTFIVITLLQKSGGRWAGVFIEQEATVSAVIGGLAMVLGILPLFSAFRNEIFNNNDRNNNGCNNYKSIPDTDSVHNRNSNQILVTIALAFTSSITINILFITFHLTERSESYSQVAEHQYGVIFPIGLFLYGIVSPFAEEVVFRGIIYNRLKKFFRKYSAGQLSSGKSLSEEKRFPIAAPILLSALLFGIYHGNVVQMLYGFLMGILIAYTYEKCGCFLYAFLFHAAANAAVYVITGNPVLYERFMTPRNGVILAVISGILLLFMKGGCSFYIGHRSGSDKKELDHEIDK